MAIETSLVWRRLSKLFEASSGSHIVWTAGLNARDSDALCHIATSLGFVSAQHLGGFLLLKRGGEAPPPRSQEREEMDVEAVDRCVVCKVEEHVQRCLADFVARRDRYLDLCISCYPLPPTTVGDICCRCAAKLHLQSLPHSIRTVRVVKRDDRRMWRWRRHRRSAASWRPTTAPLHVFPGAVIYIRHFADAQFCCEILRKARIRQFGMDTEWKPNREATADDHPTALVQLCFKTPEWMKRGCVELPTARGAEYICLLLHVVHHGVNPALAELLSDPTVAKIGVEIDSDVAKLRRHYDVVVTSAVELHHEAWRRRIYGCGLRELFRAATGTDYPKDKRMTLSNWETAPLSVPQQNYAACDAFAALRIHETLTMVPTVHRLVAYDALGE